MRFRFMVSARHSNPADLSPTMLLGLPFSEVVEDGGTRTLGTNASRFDFELPDGTTPIVAQKVGQGYAFIAGFNAYMCVSRLFVLKHSNEANIGKRSTDWSPAHE
jgi:hypothetical protein